MTVRFCTPFAYGPENFMNWTTWAHAGIGFVFICVASMVPFGFLIKKTFPAALAEARKLDDSATPSSDQVEVVEA